MVGIAEALVEDGVGTSEHGLGLFKTLHVSEASRLPDAEVGGPPFLLVAEEPTGALCGVGKSVVGPLQPALGQIDLSAEFERHERVGIVLRIVE
jgi:hypothetical protein